MKKIAIVTAGPLPVPAVKGGAVENLVENLIKENEVKGEVELHILSVYDKQAEEAAKKYNKTIFHFIKTPRIVNPIDKILFKGIKLVKRKTSQSHRIILRRFNIVREISKILSRNEFDAVVLENSAPLFLALKMKNNAEKYKNKYYYHMHNEISGSYGCEDIFNGCKKIISVSEFMFSTFPSFLTDYENNKKVVLKNGVDTSLFRPKTLSDDDTINQLKKRYGIKREEKVLMFAGRLVKEKGILELVDAFSKLKNDQVKLIILGAPFFGINNGENEYTLELKKKIEKMKKRIIFTGYIPYEKISDFYRLADISVVPSIWNEPAALTNIESICSGVELITTLKGGIPEYVRESGNTILDVDDNFVVNLTKIIEEKCINSRDANELSDIANKFREKYNQSTYYDKFVNLFNA